MKALVLGSTVAILCLANCARAQEVVTISGVRYRVAGVNSTLMLIPDAPFAAARALPHGEKLSRCDEFVARALEARGLPDSGDARLVRDRVEARPEKRTWVIYAQRHQGYRILGAGGRLEIDSCGRVLFAGLTCETEELRDFRPMDSAALEKLAAPAVPHPRVGPPIQQELMIDPLGDAPAELRAFVVYRVRNNSRVESWQVILDAETGKVVDSFSRVMNAR